MPAYRIVGPAHPMPIGLAGRRTFAFANSSSMISWWIGSASRPHGCGQCGATYPASASWRPVGARLAASHCPNFGAARVVVGGQQEVHRPYCRGHVAGDSSGRRHVGRETSGAHRPRDRREDDCVQYGFVVPWADAAEVGELAAVAERHGWDGLFVWEPVWGVDAWVSLDRGRVPDVHDPRSAPC